MQIEQAIFKEKSFALLPESFERLDIRFPWQVNCESFVSLAGSFADNMVIDRRGRLLLAGKP